MNPSPDEVSHTTCVSKRMVVGGGEKSETMNCEAIKGYEVGKGRGPMKSFPLPPCLGIPRCSCFYRLGRRVRSLPLIGIHARCVSRPKRKSTVNYPKAGAESLSRISFSLTFLFLNLLSRWDLVIYPKLPNPILTQSKLADCLRK